MQSLLAAARAGLCSLLFLLCACNDSSDDGAPPGGPAPAGTFDQLDAVHPLSAPGGPLAATADGELVAVAEGGALAFLDATSEAGLAEELKRAGVGEIGVLPVALAFDPDADPLGDPTGPASCLYVAGGRSGLWAMRADPRPGEPSRAVRLDDASLASAGAPQDSRRWCSAVEVAELHGARYVLALFAAADDSLLRLYPLEAARGALLQPAGAATELTAVAEVALAAHPGWTPAATSFAHGLAADGADVYVALGHHGVVRARFDAALEATLQGGPVFGDDSHYARAIDGRLYDDYHMYAATTDPVVIYDEPPLCLDVAVRNAGGEHHLYVAADQLGWLRFDLALELSPEMPIDHQAGVELLTPRGERQMLLLEADAIGGEPLEVATYARALDLLETPAGPVLAVACERRPHELSPGTTDEGRSLNHLGVGFRSSGTGIVGPQPAPAGDASYTLLYDLSAPLVAGSSEVAGRVRAGGRSVALASDEEGLAVFGGGSALELEHGGATMLPHATVAARFAWPPAGAAPQAVWLRDARHRPGRWIYDVAFSALSPDVLMTGSNDAGLAADGILMTCAGEVLQDFEPDPETGTDTRGTNGIVFNPGARCPADGFPGDELWWSAGQPEESDLPLWRLTRFHPGTSPCGGPDPPDLARRTFFESPPDRFEDTGRQYFSGGEIDAAHDAAVRLTPGREGWGLVYASRTGTPDGLLVLRRDLLHAAAEQAADGAVLDPEAIPGSILRTVDTHPEYGAVQATHPDSFEFVRKVDEDGFLLTFFPQLFPLPDGTAAGGERWVLAVPAGAVRLDPQHPVFQERDNPPEDGGYHPEWAPPEPWGALHDHALVRLVDASDPAQLVQMCDLVAPFPKSSAYRIANATAAGRTWLFVADFGGHLLAYDATALAELPPGTVVSDAQALWTAPECVTDELPNNIYGIAVDRSPSTPAEELDVYLGISRVGLCVLRFRPTAPAGERLTLLEIVETPGDASGLALRHGATPGEDRLLVADSHAGLRVYRR